MVARTRTALVGRASRCRRPSLAAAIVAILGPVISGLLTPAEVHASSPPPSPVAGTDNGGVVLNGVLWDWGDNSHGQLNNGTPVGSGQYSSTPAPVNIAGVKAAAMGSATTTVLLNDGTVWAWGANGAGMLGDGNNTSDSSIPVEVEAGAVSGCGGFLCNVTAIASGPSFTLALLADGQIAAWGSDSWGQLGDNSLGDPSCSCRMTPVYVAGISSATAIAAGDRYGVGMAVLSDGTARAWGSDPYGELGDGTFGGVSACFNECWDAPRTIVGLSGTVALSIGDWNAMGLTSGGQVWVWGSNYYGQFGTGGTNGPQSCNYAGNIIAGCSDTPIEGPMAGANGIAAGQGDTDYAVIGGSAQSWGYNGGGALGNGTWNSSNCCSYIPVTVSNLTSVTALAAGEIDAFAVQSDGSIWSWGDNYVYGELGDNTVNGPNGSCACQPVPTQIMSCASGPNSCPSGSELYGSANPGETNGPFDLVGAGVNMVTGNLTTSVVDIAIPGRGPGLAFTSTYNSLSFGTIGALGYGWTDSYDVHLVYDPGTGNAVVTNGNGSTVPFTAPVSGQSYGHANRVTATLAGSPASGWTYTLNDHSVYTFDLNGHLTSITDRADNQVTLTHNPTSGLLTQVAEAGTGRYLTLGYDATPRLTSVSDSFGRTVSFSYNDANSQPLELDHVTDVNGYVTYYTYDPARRLVAIRNQDANTVQFGYAGDGSNRVTSQTNPVTSEVFTFTWLPTGVAIVDPRSIETDITTNSNNDETQIVRAGVTLWRFSYDQYNNRKTAIDANGHEWDTTYDASGNVTATRDPNGNQTSTSYNSYNEPLTTTVPQPTTDGSTVTTTYTYDASYLWRLTSVSTPVIGTTQTRTTAYAYTDANHLGDVTQVTDPDGYVWRYSYDGNGYPASRIDPLNNKSTYVYDNAGRMVSSTTPKGNCTGCNPTAFTTNYTYDNENHQITVTDPLGHEVQQSYWPSGLLRTRQDADRNTTIYSYDPDGHLHVITRPDNTTQTIDYDPNGNTQYELSAAGGSNQVAYSYDSFDHVNGVTFYDGTPDGRTTAYNNDPMGNVDQIVDPSGRTTTFSYDPGNRLTGITYSDGTTPNCTFTYFNNNERASASDSVHTNLPESYVYDSLGRITQANLPFDILTYRYDLRGNVTTLTGEPALSSSVTRGFDGDGRLTSVMDWQGLTSQFSYDANSNLVLSTYPNSTKAVQTFNNADQLTSISDQTAKGTVLMSFNYTRESDGLLGSVSVSGVPGGNEAYTPYNALSQLTTVNNVATYAYTSADAISRMGSATLSYNNNPANELASATSGGTTTTFGYDPEGNRSSKAVGTTTTNYGYDMANRMVSAGSNQFVYDCDGIRLELIDTVGYHYEVTDPVTGELLQGDPNWYVYGPNGVPLEQVGSGSQPQIKYTYFYFTDQLGSVRGILNSNGQVKGTFTYDAYGNLTGTSGMAADLGYAGMQLDTVTGFYHTKTRYYDPVSGQFTARDPRISGLTSAYRYAADSPLNVTDPSGMAACGPVQAICDFFGGNGYRIKNWVGDQVGWMADHKLETLTAGLNGAAVGLTFGAAAPVVFDEAAGETLLARSLQIEGTLAGRTAASTTTAVLRAVAGDGTERIIVATSEQTFRRVWLSALRVGEIAVAGPDDAEINALAAAGRLGLRPLEIAASRPVCLGCQLTLSEEGVAILSPLKSYPALGWPPA